MSLIVLITSLVSCTDNNNPSSPNKNYTDNYLYTNINGVIYRISMITAAVTPLCPDPLCEHKDDTCPLYAAEDVCMIGQYIYYMKGLNLAGGHQKLCRFNLESGKYEVIYDPENVLLDNPCVSEKYVFFNSVLADKDYKLSHHIMRYDVETGKVKQLTDEPLSVPPRALLVDGERVYWEGGTGNDYYSTDLDYKNKKENDRGYSPNASMENYSFRVEYTDKIIGYAPYQQNAMKLTRIDRETGEELVVFDELGSVPIFYNEKIIYRKLDELRYIGTEYNEETGSSQEHYDRYGGKYYICDSDGSNERLLCDISDTNYVPQISHNILGGKIGVGDWIAVWVRQYVPADENDPNKVKRIENTYLLINIVTGEIKVAEIEKRS